MNTFQADSNAEYFLATTALEEFWDISKPMLFLGDWCQVYERKSVWGALAYKILDTPYDSPEAAHETFHRVDEIYERVLPVLGAALNSIHGKDYSLRSWRILVGPWLQLYLSATYDRFIHIKHALALYPNFTTLTLSEKSFVVPSDTLDFACSLSEDSYNLQIFTKILTALGRTFPCKEMQISQNPLYGTLLSNSWKRRIVSNVARLYAGISARLFPAVLLRNSYFSKQVELKLAIRNVCRILPMWNQVSQQSLSQYDGEKRKALQNLEFGEGEYETCLSSMLFSDVPQCFIEQFEAIGNDAHRNYPKKTGAIFSANAWYYDEAFKQWAAFSAENGTLLLGTQHGGNYGALANMASENHETAIVDRYYSWGWAREDCTATVVPMPATKLVGRKKIDPDNRKNGILWVATSAPRYLVQYPFVPMHFHDYIAWQNRFAKALPQRIISEVRFRPHYQSNGWGVVERIRECIPNIQVESWKITFQESLVNCRLYVCDHLSTTFVEALAANKPTILFWSPLANKLRPEAQSYYDLLRAVGILFDAPEDAAMAINSVYDDVETWWNNDERQASVEKFCRQFARTSPDAVTQWGEQLNRMLAAVSQPEPSSE